MEGEVVARSAVTRTVTERVFPINLIASIALHTRLGGAAQKLPSDRTHAFRPARKEYILERLYIRQEQL